MPEEKHWPDAPIEEIDADEREALLKQAGPVGENARMAWKAYQDEHPDRENPTTIARERTRLADMGQLPPEEGVAAEAAVKGEPAPEPPAAAGAGAGDIEVDAPGTGDDRAQAEAKAAKLGLEIRDYGTAGEWRVYDPATGRMVAKSRLEEAPA